MILPKNGMFEFLTGLCAIPKRLPKPIRSSAPDVKA
jgi:hypothetical protein